MENIKHSELYREFRRKSLLKTTLSTIGFILTIVLGSVMFAYVVLGLFVF